MSACDQQQDDTELRYEMQHSMSYIKSFRHNEMTLRARGGVTLIQDVLYALQTPWNCDYVLAYARGAGSACDEPMHFRKCG